MNLALYQIADQYLADVQKLQELDLDDQCFADTLESLSGDFDDKSVAVAMFVRNIEASAESIKAAEEQMSSRRKAIEKKAANIKEYLLTNMQRVGITEIACPHFMIKIKNNPESVVIDPAAIIPASYMRQPELPPAVPDKVAIKAALKAGVEINGCYLEKKQRIDIK